MANTNSATGQAKSNRRVSIAWVAGIAAVIITCLILQQTALLYVLSTLGVTILLLIVATADLKGGEEQANAER
jgi:hypothetical protein